MNAIVIYGGVGILIWRSNAYQIYPIFVVYNGVIGNGGVYIVPAGYTRLGIILYGVIGYGGRGTETKNAMHGIIKDLADSNFIAVDA